MPRKSKISPANHKDLNQEQFLYSINIYYDAESPQRIAHFHPTSKSIALINAILGKSKSKANFVIAPYGSAKSLTATYQLHLIENREESRPALRGIGKRLQHIDEDLSRFSDKRLRSKTSGLVLALTGYQTSLPEAIKSALLASMKRLKLGRQAKPLEMMPATTINEANKLLAAAQDKCLGGGLDRIAIVWDEFGRHLESLLADGRAAALGDVQTLAEFVSRSQSVPTTLSLVLHQGLLHYADNAPTSVRTEWTKIEGRFETIQYVDDSKEIYRLIGAVMQSRSIKIKLTKSVFSKAAKRSKQLGLFSDFSQSDLAELFKASYPLTPAALYLLPRISARVAQNERTLFTFLYTANLNEEIGVDQLYDYFSPVMRSDTALGGTHRQWLETQSAISKVSGHEGQGKGLKAACLLALGTGGERSRSGKELLVFGLASYASDKSSRKVVASLIESKLLLYRRHNDEVSVWHGTDADLRGRLRDEKLQIQAQFDLLEYLSKEASPPPWKPIEYNDQTGVCRYFQGEYQTVEHVQEMLDAKSLSSEIPVGCDGKIYYLVGETDTDITAAERIARSCKTEKQLLFAIPRHPLPLTDACQEIACLDRMQHDAELVGADPLVLPELQQMADDARAHLQAILQRLIWPGAHGPKWFYCGKALHVSSPRSLRRELSDIAAKVYCNTPKIFNEMIVRKKTSGPVTNSRKKLMFAILERSGIENLGISGNFPDASIFRTVLENTGIYRKDSGRWGYGLPEDIRDKNLGMVWGLFQKFLTEPSDDRKDVKLFIETLQSPPIGLRPALIPILFSAALRAFPATISIVCDGQYVTDVLPTIIEDMCRRPDAYEINVLDLDVKERKYLDGIHRIFENRDEVEVVETDLIRICFNDLEQWKLDLAPAALTTRKLSKMTSKFRTAITAKADIADVLFKKIPAACSQDPKKETQALLKAIEGCKIELEAVAGLYYEHASNSLRRALGFDRINAAQADSHGLRQLGQHWADLLSAGKTGNLTGEPQMLYSRICMAQSYATDEKLLDSLASLLIGKPIRRWDDSSAATFDRYIYDIIRRAERVLLQLATSQTVDSDAVSGLAKLAAIRIAGSIRDLNKLLGDDVKVKDLLEESLSDQMQDV